MPQLNSILAFAQITFPIFLLIPSLLTSFRKAFIPPASLARFYLFLECVYWLIALAIAYDLAIRGFWLTFICLIIYAVFGQIALRYVAKLTVEEQILRLLAPRNANM